MVVFLDINKGGKHQLNFGVLVVLGGNKVSIISKGEEVDFIAYGYFFNLFAASNALPSEVKGICAHQFKRSMDFRHPRLGRYVEFVHKHCHRRNMFERICRSRFGNKIAACVFDLCAGASRKLVFKMGKAIRKEKHKIIHRHPFKFFHLRRRPHFFLDFI